MGYNYYTVIFMADAGVEMDKRIQRLQNEIDSLPKGGVTKKNINNTYYLPHLLSAKITVVLSRKSPMFWHENIRQIPV